MLREFKEFIARGNVIDLAVAVVIGAAFGRIVTSLVEKVIMPPIGLILGNVDFSSLFIDLSRKTPPAASLLEAEAQGRPVIAYGQLINDVINFLIIAWVLFLVVRGMNRLFQREEAAPPPPAPPTKEEQLLTEIRDILKARGTA